VLNFKQTLVELLDPNQHVDFIDCLAFTKFWVDVMQSLGVTATSVDVCKQAGLAPLQELVGTSLAPDVLDTLSVSLYEEVRATCALVSAWHLFVLCLYPNSSYSQVRDALDRVLRRANLTPLAFLSLFANQLLDAARDMVKEAAQNEHKARAWLACGSFAELMVLQRVSVDVPEVSLVHTPLSRAAQDDIHSRLHALIVRGLPPTIHMLVPRDAQRAIPGATQIIQSLDPSDFPIAPHVLATLVMVIVPYADPFYIHQPSTGTSRP
jgi:hypothetical protein